MAEDQRVPSDVTEAIMLCVPFWTDTRVCAGAAHGRGHGRLARIFPRVHRTTQTRVQAEEVLVLAGGARSTRAAEPLVTRGAQTIGFRKSIGGHTYRVGHALDTCILGHGRHSIRVPRTLLALDAASDVGHQLVEACATHTVCLRRAACRGSRVCRTHHTHESIARQGVWVVSCAACAG